MQLKILYFLFDVAQAKEYLAKHTTIRLVAKVIFLDPLAKYTVFIIANLLFSPIVILFYWQVRTACLS